jgi:crossover junction endodeoxyribonuclease RuvC
MLTIYIGIDPGQTGAIAFLSDQKTIFANKVFDFDDGSALAWLQTIGTEFNKEGVRAKAIIEKVSAMPKQGVSSTFKFGTNYGQWIGRLEALAIPFDFVTPQKWKKAMFDSMVKGDLKTMALDRARRLLPNMADRLKRKMDHGRAEALLMALYAMRVS